MLEPGLRALLGSDDLWTFFADVFGRKTICFEHAPQALSDLVEDLGGIELAALLQGPRRPEINLSRADRDSWFSTASTEEALAAYADGFTAYFHVGQLRPRLLPWIDAIAEAMGVHFDAVDLSIFASPPGSITPIHYDASQNLTLQLVGEKRWRLGENRRAQSPTDNWAPGMPPSPHWNPGPWTDGPDLPEGIDGLESLTLSPGAGLYVPGGHWHAVESLGHSLALTYSVNVTRELDLVIEALTHSLAEQASLRAPRMLRGRPQTFEPLPALGAEALRSGRGLHPKLWPVLCQAPAPIGVSVLEVAIAASGLDRDALTEHAWATLWIAQDVLTFEEAAKAHIVTLLKAGCAQSQRGADTP